MSTIHKNLTGADLHESKGVDTALASQVYVSNGSGSGVWTTVANLVTAGGFSTGDLKPTWKTSADSGWIMADDGTIGDGSSGATNRANADTVTLFTLIWNNFSNALAAVSGGRGANAAADYAAHKTIALPKMLGRSIALAGTGSGLTARTLGATVGEENHLLTTAEMPAHTHANSLSDPGHQHTYNNSNAPVGGLTGGGAFPLNTGDQTSSTSNVTTGITITNASAGSGGTHNNMQPTSFVNMMVKL